MVWLCSSGRYVRLKVTSGTSSPLPHLHDTLHGVSVGEKLSARASTATLTMKTVTTLRNLLVGWQLLAWPHFSHTVRVTHSRVVLDVNRRNHLPRMASLLHPAHQRHLLTMTLFLTTTMVIEMPRLEPGPVRYRKRVLLRRLLQLRSPHQLPVDPSFPLSLTSVIRATNLQLGLTRIATSILLVKWIPTMSLEVASSHQKKPSHTLSHGCCPHSPHGRW